MAKEKEKSTKQAPEEKPSKGALVAKKDFVLVHNDYARTIVAGDDLSDVPAIYHENLRTEGVL